MVNLFVSLGLKSDFQIMEDDVTGVKNNIQNIEASVSGKCRHCTIVKWIFEIPDLKRYAIGNVLLKSSFKLTSHQA